jgi:hypothetical protein
MPVLIRPPSPPATLSKLIDDAGRHIVSMVVCLHEILFPLCSLEPHRQGVL